MSSFNSLDKEKACWLVVGKWAFIIIWGNHLSQKQEKVI